MFELMIVKAGLFFIFHGTNHSIMIVIDQNDGSRWLILVDQHLKFHQPSSQQSQLLRGHETFPGAWRAGSPWCKVCGIDNSPKEMFGKEPGMIMIRESTRWKSVFFVLKNTHPVSTCFQHGIRSRPSDVHCNDWIAKNMFRSLLKIISVDI